MTSTTSEFQLNKDNSFTHILTELYVVVPQTAPRGPLARLFHSKHTPSMALELAHLAGEAIPGHAVEHLPTDVAVSGTTVAAGKPAVLTFQVLKGLQYIL